MKRAKTKAELEADNFKNTSHEKPLRGEPQLVIKEVQQALTVEHEKTNYLACLKIANLACTGNRNGAIFHALQVRGVPCTLIDLLDLKPREYSTPNYVLKRKMDPVWQDKIAGAAAAALTIIYAKVDEDTKHAYIALDIVGRTLKLWYVTKNKNTKARAHGLLRVMGLLHIIPHQGNAHAAGGHALLPHIKFQRTFGDRYKNNPKYPTPIAGQDYQGLKDNRLMFKQYDRSSFKVGYCPHCKERGHFIDTCPVRKKEKFVELQNINAFKAPTPVKKVVKKKFRSLG